MDNLVAAGKNPTNEDLADTIKRTAVLTGENFDNIAGRLVVLGVMDGHLGATILLPSNELYRLPAALVRASEKHKTEAIKLEALLK